MHRPITKLLLFAVVLAMPSACVAYIYDAGNPQHQGGSVTATWVAAPFMVTSDCFATSIGAAVARALGPADAGFDVYLADTWNGLLDSAIAKLPQRLIPLGTQYVYYDGALSRPVFLKAGTTYSVILVPTSPDLICSISWAVKPGTYYGWSSRDCGQNWQQMSYPVAVRVDGYSVPEAKGWVVLFAAVAALSLPALCGAVSRRAADPA